MAVLVASCGGIIDPSKNTVDPFSGTLQIGATNFSTHSVGKNGEVEVTITSVVPSPPNGSLAIALGQVVGQNCTPLAGYVASGVVNRKVQFGFVNKGSYCLLVYDPGVLTVPVAYSGTFSHP